MDDIRTIPDSGGGTSEDAFLGGRFAVLQPRRGRHRAGLDALLLAAAVPTDAQGHLVDLGSGVGVAGLAAATRAPGLAVTLVERDPVAADLARRSRDLGANAHLAGRVTVVETDLLVGETARIAAGLLPGTADWVILNPPFYADGTVRTSPSEARRAAHVLAGGDLARWLKVAGWLMRPHGRLALIFRGDAVAEVLDAMAGRFGAVTIHPVAPRAGEAAHRLVVTGIRGSRAKPALMPGLVLHPPGGNTYLPEADAILRGQAGWPHGRV